MTDFLSFNADQASRRRFLRALGFGAAAMALPCWYDTPGVFAEELTLTPSQTAGPYYPDKLPLDTDNDLLIVNDRITPAVGTIVHLSGRVLDAKGTPVRNALVEIWQVDSNASYLHTKSGHRKRLDANFQGFGRFLTNHKGEYYFRTIKPVPYTDGPVSRASHIHVAVKIPGQKMFTTQCYVKGDKKNASDLILKRFTDPKVRENLIVDFKPIRGSKIGELAGKFDIVLGLTPEA